MTQFYRRPDADFLSDNARTIRGRVIRMHRHQAPNGEIVGRFTTTVEAQGDGSWQDRMPDGSSLTDARSRPSIPLAGSGTWQWIEPDSSSASIEFLTPSGDKPMTIAPRPTAREELAREVDRLRSRGDQLGEIMAEALGSAADRLPPERSRLFPLGRVELSPLLDFRNLDVPFEAIRGAVEGHQAGDFGLLGKLDDAPDLDDDMLWCPAAYGTAVERAVAIRNGRGVVMSHHRIEYQAKGRAEVVEVIIRTGLGGPTLVEPAQGRKPTLSEGLPERPDPVLERMRGRGPIRIGA